MSDNKEKNANAEKYRDTVFLPVTDFPMRGGLPQKEPEIIQKWQEISLYEKMRERAKDREKFILHDGPPYANGNIHMGHAVNKILKDVVIKSWSMMGYDTPYVPGWDCHGLPIEWKIEEKYRNAGKDKDDVDKLAFRDECRKFAKEWVDTQSAQFQRLGVSGDWKNPYLTMTNRAESLITKEIHKFATNGGLYKGAKPVMWSVVEKTALAEAEVEYQEHKSVTVWVKFPIVAASPFMRGETDSDENIEKQKVAELLQESSIVIWTTTPWTLPSNRAVAYGEGIEYGIYEVQPSEGEENVKNGEKIVLATSLVDDVMKQAKIENFKLLKTFKGNREIGIACKHPLAKIDKHYDEFDVPLLAGDFVTDDAGTGFVHIAPGHGEDDFYLGTANNIEVTDNVTDDGKFREHVGLFAGLEVYTQDGKLGEGNFAVLRELVNAGKLLAKGSLKHEYPHSWRSKAPLIFRTTPQWFIAMDKNMHPSKPLIKSDNMNDTLETWRGEKLREKALHAIHETNWIPSKGEARITAMVANRPDWCISRQRAWGVPIAIFLDKKTGEILKDEEVLNRIVSTFEEEGSDAWWSRNAQDFLGKKYNAEDYDQIFDIVDVWFESGSTHAFVIGDTKTWPCFEGVEQIDLYLEGSDQHRGWFHSSLLESCGTKGHAPYKNVLTHGFVLDEKGYKMSKSLGNVVDPLKMMEQYGADIIRLWVMLSDYAEDIRIGKDTLKNTGDLYRRIRNTLRFLLGALHGFSESERIPRSDYDKMPELERYMLHRLFEMDKFVRECIQNYEFGKLAKTLHDFCNQELSAFYFDIRKDRLYCDALDSFERRACRTVMAEIFDCLVTWLAPILCFTTEEAWSYRPSSVFDETESVHLRDFPDVPDEWKNADLFKKWQNIIQIRSVVTAAIEPLRTSKELGSSLEAHVKIFLIEHYKQHIHDIDLEEISIISGAAVEFVKKMPDGVFMTTGFQDMIGVNAQKASGHKCQRCWKILPEVTTEDEICNRCADAIKEHPPKAKSA
ncbi:MAG: isoleucine--tRNA ligase [Alphaproteobacteria bacterium]|nr:isoleucine--tRNA ligase [Alphaproteobacteria bacterium]